MLSASTIDATSFCTWDRVASAVAGTSAAAAAAEVCSAPRSTGVTVLSAWPTDTVRAQVVPASIVMAAAAAAGSGLISWSGAITTNCGLSGACAARTASCPSSSCLSAAGCPPTVRMRPTVAWIGPSVTSATALPAADGSGDSASGLGSALSPPGSAASLSSTVDAPPPTRVSRARLVSEPPTGQVSNELDTPAPTTGSMRACTCGSSAGENFSPERATALTSGLA